MLFDSPKDLVFGKILAPKFFFDFSFKFKFGYMPLDPKKKLLKCSLTSAILRLKTTSGENFSKIEAYLWD